MPRARLNEDDFSNHLLQEGDLVITRSGTCGIAAVFDTCSLPVLPGAFLIRFRLNASASPEFFRFYFNSPVGRANILSVARGAVQQNLNITNIELLRVPLPPRENQDVIASILSTYDELMENNRQRMGLLEKVARLLYQEWFVRLRFPGYEHTPIADGVPQSWETRKLGQCATFYSGGTPDKGRGEYWDGDIPWVSSGEMTTPRICDATLHISEAGAEDGSRLVPPNTILAVVRGMSLAKEFRVAITTGTVAFNQDLKALIVLCRKPFVV